MDAMGIRDAANYPVARTVFRAMHRLNQRHPWSHNDAFHPWIASRLPQRRDLALDVGCGRGELAATLAPRFSAVHAIDKDQQMRHAAALRTAGFENVTVDDTDLFSITERPDLVTMIAVLHHLNLEAALRQVAALLNDGGRFLCVGLARPESAHDHLWDVASMVTNPLIGYVRHPWPAVAGTDMAPFPTIDPTLTVAQITDAAQAILPGSIVRRHLGFRHTIEWTKHVNP
jgi:SAM-dependent methyltransferase